MAIEAIKARLRIENVTRWMVAEELNVCEMTIVRWLRTELTAEKYDLINSAISKIVSNRNSKEV